MIARSFALSLVLAAAFASGAAPVFAQNARSGAPSPANASSAPIADPTRTPDAKIEHLVTEDSQMRVEETRVRGVTTKIVVHSKIPGVGTYEVQPKDPSQDPENDHGAGMRLFSFGF